MENRAVTIINHQSTANATKDIQVVQKTVRRHSRSERLRSISRVDYLVESEYVSLICAAQRKGKQEHVVLMQTLWETGLRITEALSLTRANLQPDGLLIIGKGSKQRFVPCQPRLVDSLKLLANRPEHTAVFRKPTSRSAAFRMLKGYAKEINLAKRIHPHLFRHSFAINFIQQTGNPFALQDIGGWSDMETIKIYMRLAKEAPREAMQKMSFPVVEV